VLGIHPHHKSKIVAIETTRTWTIRRYWCWIEFMIMELGVQGIELVGKKIFECFLSRTWRIKMGGREAVEEWRIKMGGREAGEES
jgi:hypothetical protein